jgi:FkbM family methyltransferase
MGAVKAARNYIQLRYGHWKGNFVVADVPGFPGQKVVVPGDKDMVGTYDEVFISNTFDRFQQLPHGLIIDAGANIGLTSILFSKRFPKNQIVCLEPEPDNIRLLKENLKGLSNIHILPWALYFRSGSVILNTSSGNSLSHTITIPGEKVSNSVEVRTVTVKEILAKFKADKIALFKIDIEGAEVELFAENIDWIDLVENFCIEFHERKRPGSETKIIQLLMQRGYQVERAGLNHCFYRR